MKNLFLALITVTFLSSSAFGVNMKCANGNLDISLGDVQSANGQTIVKDKLLSAKGKFTENKPSPTMTRMTFKDGKIEFVTVTLTVAISVRHDILFSEVITHKTTSASGEWSTYEVKEGKFNSKGQGSTYLQVNNFNNTATIFKSNNKEDVWLCK